MATLQATALLILLVSVSDWLLITSGERTGGSAKLPEETRAVDSEPSAVELSRRAKHGKSYNHRLVQSSAAEAVFGHQRRVGGMDARRLQPASSADKPLIRRKRIKRDGREYRTINRQKPIEKHIRRPPSHRPRPATVLHDEDSKQKPGQSGNFRSRKLVRRRDRFHSPASQMNVGSQRWINVRRDRKSPKPKSNKQHNANKTSTTAHHHSQESRDPRLPLSGHYHHIYHPGPGEPGSRLSANHHVSTESSLSHIHHVPIPHRPVPVSGSEDRRHPVKVALKSSEPGGRIQHRWLGVTEPVVGTKRRRGTGQRSRAAGDAKKRSHGARSKRSRSTKKQSARKQRRTSHRVSKRQLARSTARSVQLQLTRLKRHLAVRRRHI